MAGVYGWQPTNWMTPYPEPLDEAAYHGVVGEFVRRLAPQTEADPVGILACTLAACGNVLGTARWAEASGKRHHPRLNILLIGPTASRKGTAQAVVDAVHEYAAPGWLRGRVKTGLSTGEGLIGFVRDETRTQEAIRDKAKLVVGYQEVVTDPGVADKRLLVVEEEFGRTLRVLSRDGNTLSPILRAAWDGNPLSVMTKQPVNATENHISIVGHITPKELRELLRDGDVANGLANRFLFFAVRRAQILPRARSLDRATLEYLGNLLGGIYQDADGHHGWREYDDEAYDLWEQVYPEVSRDREGLAGAATSRAEAQVLRLALLYALLDTSPAIRVPHLRAALAVWRYCEDTAYCLFGASTGDPVMDTILVALQARGLSQTELSNRFSRHVANLEETLELLEERGAIRRETIATGGRPRTVWHLVRPGEPTPEERAMEAAR